MTQAEFLPACVGFGRRFERAGSAEGRGAPAAEAAPLGNNADLVAAPDILALLPPCGTVTAWMMRAYAREIFTRGCVTPRLRMRWCGSKISKREFGVEVYRRPTLSYGRLGGVCVCGQSLCCPVCAPRIAAFRAAEVAECFKRAASMGYEARLVTFTMPHSLGENLDVLLELQRRAWAIVAHSRSASKRRRYSLGYHLGNEITWGNSNGWHPHKHQLRYDKPGTYCAESDRADWLSALDNIGRKTAGAERRAFDCGTVGDEAGARYVAKLATSVEAQGRAVGSEIASAATKGRNFNSLLRSSFADRDHGATSTWLEGVLVVTSAKLASVRWSRGLRSVVGLSVEEPSDEAVAAETVTEQDQLLGCLTPMQWAGILRHSVEFHLCCAAQNGRSAVNSFLSGLELGQLCDDPASFHVYAGRWDKKLKC
jgi:hypothetical protein